MKHSLGIDEITKLLQGEFGDPHSVLGMHVIGDKEEAKVILRAQIPGAVTVSVVDKATKETFPVKKIHEDGFFESILPGKTDYFPYELLVDFGNGHVWQTPDPYTFAPTVSEYDRYLFGAGNHYEIYEKLGAHLREMDGVWGVAFAVWAPNAKSVSVIGDFNQWDTRRSMMRLLGESGIWEIFIPGLREMDLYKFAVKGQNGQVVYKSDPYGTYAQLRPDTASVVYDISGYDWQDEEWMAFRTTKDQYNRPMNIYEVHLGSWKRVVEDNNRFLTYRELGEQLSDYVTKMGYTHVEILPITEYPFDGSWGYQVTGYYAPTSRYGTPKEFMELVDVLHRHNIGVIMDWVPAHFPKDAHGLARFDGSALYEHQDWRQGEHKEWGTYVFNYGRNEVRNFLIANALYWLKEYHIDGLRVDAVASMLYLDYCRRDGEWLPNCYGGRENLEAVEFLKHLNSVVQNQCPGAMMIAEESTSWEGVTRDVKHDGLGFSLKWNMGWMNDFLSFLKKETVHRKYHHNYLTFSMMYAYSENYVLVLSHDEVVHMKGSMMYKAPGDRWQKFANLRTAYGYMYAHPGKKLNFMGNDLAQYSEWSEARSIDWHLLQDEDHRRFHNYMKALYALYRNEPAFWEKDFDPWGFQWIECDDSEHSIVSFARRGYDRKEQVAVVCNFTERPYENFILGVPEDVPYQEIFNSDWEEFGGTNRRNEGLLPNLHQGANRCAYSVSMTLPPLSFVVLKPVFD